MRQMVCILACLLILIGVTPVAAADKLVDETVTVPAGNFRWYAFATNQDKVRVVINVDVLSGNDISVYLMTEEEYNIAMGDGEGDTIFERELVGSFEVEVTLGDKGTYYVILDNQYSTITSKQVHIVIEVKPSEESEFILGLILLAVVVVLAGGGIWFWRRRKKVAE